MRRGVHQPTYRSWQMMKNRCLNPAAKDFARYGGRGIKVSQAWVNYDSFLADMGERPQNTTLERKDSNGDYTKQNCCWADRHTQAQNRDYVLSLTFEGKTQRTWEWAEQLGVQAKTIHVRLWKWRAGQISHAQVFEPNRRK